MKQQRSISVIHPSRGRSKQAVETIKNWIQKATTNGIYEYILSVEPDNLSDYRFQLGLLRGFVKIMSDNNKSAIEAINKAANFATGDIIIVVSDDFDCPEHWDTLLLEALEGKEDFCAKTSDGHQNWLITLPIMDRKYYDRFGYIYNPAYTHMYSDLEMTCVAWMLNRYIKLPLEFKHNHPSIKNKPLDETYIRNYKTWGSGKKIFKERMHDNFGIRSLISLPKEELFKQGIAV